MSRGPGRIERAIRALLDAHPDEAFTTFDLCDAAYPDGLELEHKHLVAVMRAANKVLAGDPDWRSLPAPYDRRTVVFCNLASVPSMVMRHHRQWTSRARAVERTREILDTPEPPLWQREQRDRAARGVRAHLAVRDADPVRADQLRAEHQAEGAKERARLAETIRATLAGRPAYVLTTANGDTSSTHIALAAKARALISANDPDAIRAGLAEIADELVAMHAG